MRRNSTQWCTREKGRLARPLKKELALTRWMGCKIAVYDLTVQEKASRRAETSRPRRGSKRRGVRGKCVEGRKRRRMAPAAPVQQNPERHQDTQFRRSSYLVGRRKAWAERRLDELNSLWSKWHKSEKGTRKRRSYRAGYLRGCARWAAVSAAASREDHSFALIRLRVLLKVKTFGWGSLASPNDITEIVPLAPVVKPPSQEVERRGSEEIYCDHRSSHKYCETCGGCYLRINSPCERCAQYDRRVERTSARKTRPRVAKAPGWAPPSRFRGGNLTGTSWSSGSESETESKKKGKGKGRGSTKFGSVRSPRRRGGGQ